MKNQLVRKSICTLLAFSILFLSTGCAGRTARPIQVQQMGDYNKSCTQLENEINTIQYQVAATPVVDKTGSNAALFIIGLFVWPAWLFMDLGNAEQVERNALTQRQGHLNQIYFGKDCVN